MVRAFIVAGLGLVCALAVGCSSKSSDAGAAGAAGASASNGGMSGRGGASSVSGPAIASAPPAWVRPADCGGIGNLCPNLSGCGDRSVCQLFGNVCVTKFDDKGQLSGRTPETPYCAAYQCMSFDDASCFCTGEAGKSVPQCHSPAELALLCTGESFGCGNTACCDGLQCVTGASGAKSCQKPCAAATDCPDTGCCADPNESGKNVCSPKAACDNPCKRTGQACDNTASGTCCTGGCLQSDNPDFNGCRPECGTNADCASGCCQLYSDSTSKGFCTAAKYCSCGAVGVACSGHEPACCAGNSCAVIDGNASCLPACKVDGECASKCCLLFTGEDNGVCREAAACGL